MSGYYENQNPNLLDPMATTANKVSPLPQHAGMTKALPVRLLSEEQTEYFMCTMPNHHMHRTDGKRLAFVFGVLATRDVYDIQYLQDEIDQNNPYVRKASTQEVQVYNMRTDPRGTMTREMTPEIENRVRVELEVKLRAEMERKLNYVGITLTDEQRSVMDKIMGEPAGASNADSIQGSEVSDSTKIQSMDALARLKANFEGGIKTGNATIMPTGGSTLQQSSITGSDKTVNFAPAVDDINSGK